MKPLVRGRRRRRVLSVFLIAAIASLFPLSAYASGSAAAADGWTNVTSNLANIQSECGNLTLLSAVPHSNTVIAGVAQQGLWATADGGASWQPLGTGKGSARITNRPSWISYDPLDSARFHESGIYNGAGAYATTNGGTTFSQLGPVTHNDFVSVDYADPGRKTLLVGGHEQSRTVWKSVDAGTSWTNVGVNLPPDSGISSDPLLIDQQTYVVNTAAWGQSTPGIFRTTDGGATWTRVSSLGPTGQPLLASDGSIYWAVADGLTKSSDHGLTWSIVGGGFVSGVHPIEVPGGRLVTAKADTLVVSSDGGAVWEPFGAPLPYAPAGVVYSENQKALYIWHWDCGTRVLPDAIQKLSYEFGLSLGAPIASPGLPENSASPGPATVRLLANWVSPTYLAPGQSLTVFQDMFASQSMTLTLAVDVFDSQGQLVLHSSLDNQTLAAEQTTRLTLTVPVPTSLQSGTYVVKTAALGPDGDQYAQSDSAGQFVANAPRPTPVPVNDSQDDPDQSEPAPSDGQ